MRVPYEWEIQKKDWIPWAWNYEWLQAVMWVLVIQPGPPKEELVLPISGPPLYILTIAILLHLQLRFMGIPQSSRRNVHFSRVFLKEETPLEAASANILHSPGFIALAWGATVVLDRILLLENIINVCHLFRTFILAWPLQFQEPSVAWD